MKQFSNDQILDRVLLVADEFTSAHALRDVADRSGLYVDLEQVSSREELFGRLATDPPALVLINLAGLPRLMLSELLQHARSLDPPLPVVVLGNEDRDAAGPASALRDGAAEYLHCTQIERLPLIIDRLLRVPRLMRVNEGLQLDLDRTAQVLRDNQKLVTIGRLTASIAHEINNPLEAITNLLYLLKAEGLPAEAAEYLDMAQRELDRVIQITRQTLNFYRERPAVVRLKPADLLEEVLVLYGRKIEEKQLTVVRDFDCDELVSAFPGEIRQVFSNLITNAIEACGPSGKLHLRVRRGRHWSGQGRSGLRISIGDTGSGISVAARRRLGEPFFTTKGQSGTGLGLWVTQSIIERYGGYLQVCSATRPDRHGTVFSLFLPTWLGPQLLPSSGGSGTTGSRPSVDANFAPGGRADTSRYRKCAS
ncbi:MAG TPA: ATP-binding protein [Acidisarcina sp.]